MKSMNFDLKQYLYMKKKLANKLCYVFGHLWRYKDYSDWMKENGDSYDFKASRNCSRCNQQEYLYSDWVTETKNFFYDVRTDSESSKQEPHLNLSLKILI